MNTFSAIDGGSELNLYGDCSELVDAVKKSDKDFFRGWYINRRGIGSGFARYAFVLERDGLRLCIGRDDRWESTPPSRLIVGYSWLRRQSFVIDSLRVALEAVGHLFKIEKHTLSRIDINCTIDKPISEIDALIDEHFFTYARKFQRFFRKFQGRQVLETVIAGNEEISLHIYDKSRELSEVADSIKYEDLEQVFGEDAQLTRFEWRLRRRFLMRYNIDNLEDLEQNWAGLMDYLTSWARFQESVASCNNHRIAILDWWLEIVKSLKSITEHNKHYEFIRNSSYKRISGKYLLTFKRALSTLALSLVPVCENYDSAVEKLSWLFERFYNTYNEKFNRKRQRYLCQIGSL